jgi:hypothetical protein
MEIDMSLKPVVFALSLLAITAVPAFADSYKWGALSLDTEKVEKEPYYGVGGADTEKEAGDLAVEECTKAGGANCTLAVTYEQCGALAVSGKGEAGWGKAPTKSGAEKQALDGCKGDSCSVVVSDCNEE